MSTETLRAAVRALEGRRVLVIGDAMLDAYVWGAVSRISPDAPVQVVDIQGRSVAAGGAANVAANIVAAGGSAILAGVVGEDSAGAELLEILGAIGVGGEAIVRDAGRPTTVKTRVVARGQHVVRLDQETRTPLAEKARARLLTLCEAHLRDCDAVVVSDYAKGVVDRTLVPELSRALTGAGLRIPVVVDPKSNDLTTYRGCTAITPNQKEAEAATGFTLAGLEDVGRAAGRIREACLAPWVLITRGAKGMVLSGSDGSLEVIEADSREVYDVTGAGDTAIAYFGLGLAAGLSALDSAGLANRAAGVSVAKVGTTVVSPSEILAASMGATGGAWKIVGLSEAADRAEHERSRGRKIVFTNGCFDILHAGHVHLLEKARAMGDLLVVGTNTDASVRRLKGEGRPLVGEVDRAKILSALDAVNLVVLFDEDTPIELIKAIRPDVLVKGGDYRTETIVGHELVLGYGGRVETIPLLDGRSTTGLIAEFKKSANS